VSSQQIVRIRRARLDDADAIGTLMNQLGYEVPLAEIAGRLQRRIKEREIFVALRGGRLIGWTAVSTGEPFVEGFGAHLEGLVVDESVRNRGVGAQLIEAAETWARQSGCVEMRVQSNVVRARAHAFYERHGYATIKTQHHLRKRL
jgi:GNAT superfamily N-acetyltransferase